MLEHMLASMSIYSTYPLIYHPSPAHSSNSVKCQCQCAYNRYRDSRPPRNNNLAVGKLAPSIPNQMPYAIEAMIRERHGNHELAEHFQ